MLFLFPVTINLLLSCLVVIYCTRLSNGRVQGHVHGRVHGPYAAEYTVVHTGVDMVLK